MTTKADWAVIIDRFSRGRAEKTGLPDGYPQALRAAMVDVADEAFKAGGKIAAIYALEGIVVRRERAHCEGSGL